jgi:hypothetical protein
MSETDRDVGQSDDEAHDLETEFLDDTSDAHAVWFGYWRGIRKLNPRPQRTESKQEIHYFQIGYVFGTITQAILAAVGIWGMTTL